LQEPRQPDGHRHQQHAGTDQQLGRQPRAQNATVAPPLDGIPGWSRIGGVQVGQAGKHLGIGRFRWSPLGGSFSVRV
jgi:hypothetical protein